MMLDPAVAGEPRGPEVVLAVIPQLPPEIAGIPVRRALEELARCLSDAPAPPVERRKRAESAVAQVDVARIEQAILWVTEALEFELPVDATLDIDVCVVADGVPLGGLTGQRLDERPVCFAAVAGQEGSTFAEVLIHEATHAVDMVCEAKTSVVARLRSEPGASHQLWHVHYFVAAAKATRRFVDHRHEDYGRTHGYYAKVPTEMSSLRERGVLDRITSR